LGGRGRFGRRTFPILDGREQLAARDVERCREKNAFHCEGDSLNLLSRKKIASNPMPQKSPEEEWDRLLFPKKNNRGVTLISNAK